MSEIVEVPAKPMLDVCDVAIGTVMKSRLEAQAEGNEEYDAMLKAAMDRAREIAEQAMDSDTVTLDLNDRYDNLFYRGLLVKLAKGKEE